MGLGIINRVYKLPKANLLATVYEDDDEAADHGWHKY